MLVPRGLGELGPVRSIIQVHSWLWNPPMLKIGHLAVGKPPAIFDFEDIKYEHIRYANQAADRLFVFESVITQPATSKRTLY